jgi:hypothetical protein
MDQCRLTPEQIKSLSEGKSVIVSYQTLEEYGRVDNNEIQLVPHKDLEIDVS